MDGSSPVGRVKAREKFVHELLGRDESTVLQQRSEEETFLFALQCSLGRFPHLGGHGVRHLAMAAEKGPGWRLGQRPLLHVRMEVMKWAATSISSSTTKAMDRKANRVHGVAEEDMDSEEELAVSTIDSLWGWQEGQPGLEFFTSHYLVNGLPLPCSLKGKKRLYCALHSRARSERLGAGLTPGRCATAAYRSRRDMRRRPVSGAAESERQEED